MVKLVAVVSGRELGEVEFVGLPEDAKHYLQENYSGQLDLREAFAEGHGLTLGRLRSYVVEFNDAGQVTRVKTVRRGA